MSGAQPHLGMVNRQIMKRPAAASRTKPKTSSPAVEINIDENALVLVEGGWCNPQMMLRKEPDILKVRAESNKFLRLDLKDRAKYMIEMGHYWPRMLAGVMEASR